MTYLGLFEYFKHVLGFTSENIDVERYKPTYSLSVSDCREYGGSLSAYFEIYLSYGVSWEDDFERTYELTSLLVGEQIDRNLSGKDTERLFSKIFVVFRPKADYIKDFQPF